MRLGNRKLRAIFAEGTERRSLHCSGARFSTLYTNLDLTEIKRDLEEMADLLFKGGRRKFICVSLQEKQFFSSKEYRSYYCFTKVKLLKAISFILDNTYVVFADFVLRQDFGIPIGGNSSSEIANCTLGWCEFVYMRSLVKDKKWNLAKLLSRNSRYVDDLITLNYTNFGTLYSDIYPEGLLMERSGDNDGVINYLDLNITFDDQVQ